MEVQREKTVLEAHYGEIHVLLGDAGAGKSAALQALSDAWVRGERRIEIPCVHTRHTDAKEEAAQQTQAAREEPVVCTYQSRHPNKAHASAAPYPPPGAKGVASLCADVLLVEEFTVLDNLLLAKPETQVGLLSRGRALRRAERLCEHYKLDVPLKVRVQDLDAQTRLRAAVLRMIYRDAELMIFDEVAVRVTPQEGERIARVARTLALEGRAVVWASRHGEDAVRWGDRVSVLSEGFCVGEAGVRGLNVQELDALVQGDEAKDETVEPVAVQTQDEHESMPLRVRAAASERTYSPGRAVLMVRNLSVQEQAARHRKKLAVNNVSFSVREGEIFAILSLPYNGEDELSRALAGFARVKSGQIFVGAQEITRLHARERFECGIGYLPGERALGLLEGMSLRENLIMRTFKGPRFAPQGFLRKEPIDAFVRERCTRFSLPGGAVMPRALTSGERVRAILARETAPGMRLLIAQEPTRGLDAAERERVHEVLRVQRDHAHGVLLLTTYVDEALELSDHIAVLCKGQIVAQVDARYATAQELGLYMAGTRRGERD